MKNRFNKDILSSFFLEVLDYRGKTPKKLNSDWKDKGYRAISANNVKTNGLQKMDSIRYVDEKTYHKWMKLEIQRGDLLLTSEAPAGEVMLWDSDEKIVLSQRLFGLRVNDKIYNKYLKYYLQSDLGQKEILKNTSGSTVFGISAKMFNLINVYYPTKSEQIFIGDLLSNLDAKIEVNNKINQELEAMAKLLYDYWFVQFDFPDENGKPYKSCGGKMVFNKELKREIPEGWEVKELGDIAEIRAGGDRPKVLSSTKTELCKVPIYSNGITNEGLYGYTNKAKIFKQSVTVTGRGANVGYSVLRNIPFLPIIRLLVITPKFPFYSKFLYERIRDLNFQNSGSAQPQITVPQISSLLVLMPNSEIIKKYDILTSSGVKAIENNKKQNQKLSELRDWLLPMLMNGQVTVGEAEEELGMVVEDKFNYIKE